MLKNLPNVTDVNLCNLHLAFFYTQILMVKNCLNLLNENIINAKQAQAVLCNQKSAKSEFCRYR